MVRVSRKAKAESNARIVDVAARLFRENGIESTAVGDVMKAAGLTHGGFYRHFGSKDELVAIAISKAFDGVIENLEKDIAERGGEPALDDYISQYLSLAHRRSLGAGCPLAALASDASRGSASFKKAMTEGATRLTDIIAGILANSTEETPKADLDKYRNWATGLLAVLVGSMVQARAIDTEETATEILSIGHQLAQNILQTGLT